MKQEVNQSTNNQERIKELESELQQRTDLLIELMARNHDLRTLVRELTEETPNGKARIFE